MESLTQSPNSLRPLLQLDPWAADYEGAIQIDPGDENAPEQVDVAVETAEWKACPAPEATGIPSLYFVDGVRRTEARVLAWDQGNIIHGLFGTIAAGAVRSSDGKANLVIVMSVGY